MAWIVLARYEQIKGYAKMREQQWTKVSDWSDGLGLPNLASEEKKSNIMGLRSVSASKVAIREPKKLYFSITIIIIVLKDFIFTIAI
jgi:hypothetical protein